VYLLGSLFSGSSGFSAHENMSSDSMNQHIRWFVLAGLRRGVIETTYSEER
jgi:hypothetical protein